MTNETAALPASAYIPAGDGTWRSSEATNFS